MFSSIVSAKGLLSKFSMTALLREQLAVAKARNSELESENKEVRVKFGLEQASHQKTREELERLKHEHAEDVRIWQGVEFRRGTRTGGRWTAFCPKCHSPIVRGSVLNVRCSANCDWSCNLTPEEVNEAIAALNQTET